MSGTARQVIVAQLCDWDTEHNTADYAADRTIAALDAAGFVIVPKEPTEAMIDAGSGARFESTARGNSKTVSAYRAMIEARP